jgi:putative RecB family exonuclease
MSIHELRKSPHLSVSSINDYVECGLLYKFSRVDQIPVEQKSHHLFFGSAIHKALEFWYQAKQNGHTKPVAFLHEVFSQEWLSCCENQSILFYDGETVDSCLQKGKDLLTVYHEQIPKDHFKVLATEHEFSFQIPGVDVPMIGVMDLIQQDEAGNLIITDFKTAGRSYSKDEIDKNLQLTVYSLAAKQNGFADQEILLRFDCLIKTKKPKFEQYYTIRTDEDHHRAIKKIQEVWQGIQKKVFVPNDNSWRCNHCSYKNHCDQWFQIGKEKAS